MKHLNKPKKLGTKQLSNLLNLLFTHQELKEIAEQIKAPIGKVKAETIRGLVSKRKVLGQQAIALDIS